MGKNIPVVCSSDSQFFLPMIVLLHSLACTSKGEQQVYVIDGGLNSNNRSLLRSVDEGSPMLDIRVVYPLPKHLQIIRSARLNNSAQILRIFASDLLPRHIDQYVYLDSDIILNEDVSRLAHANLEGNTIGAVQDFKIGHMASFLGVAYHEEAGIPGDAPYFNSGVMVVDRANWDRKQLTARLSKCLVRFGGRHRFGDQDSLNTVLYEDWKPLDPKWNVQTVAYRNDFADDLIYDPSRIRAAIQAPSLYHFTEVKKPWHLDCDHPMRDVFRQNARECKFIGVKEAGMFIAKDLPMTLDRWLRNTSRPFRHSARSYIQTAFGRQSEPGPQVTQPVGSEKE